MAIDKSTWNKNIKVSQKTIDYFKSMGMKRSLEMANMFANQGKGLGAGGKDVRAEGQKFLKGEMGEAVRRLYGDRRYGKSTTSPQYTTGFFAGSPKKSTVKKKATPAKTSAPYSNTQAKKTKTSTPYSNTQAPKSKKK